MSYHEDYQFAITYEIEQVKFELIRREYSFFNYFSSLGGFGSLLLGLSKILNILDSPQLYVASDMAASKQR